MKRPPGGDRRGAWERLPAAAEAGKAQARSDVHAGRAGRESLPFRPSRRAPTPCPPLLRARTACAVVALAALAAAALPVGDVTELLSRSTSRSSPTSSMRSAASVRARPSGALLRRGAGTLAGRPARAALERPSVARCRQGRRDRDPPRSPSCAPWKPPRAQGARRPDLVAAGSLPGSSGEARRMVEEVRRQLIAVRVNSREGRRARPHRRGAPPARAQARTACCSTTTRRSPCSPTPSQRGRAGLHPGASRHGGARPEARGGPAWMQAHVRRSRAAEIPTPP